MTTKQQPPRRLSALDMFKGLAILAVVLLHIQSGLPKTVGFDNAFPQLSLALNQLLRFSVPLFVALSGYTLAIRYPSSQLSLRHFYRRRFERIVPLYLLWFMVHALIFTLIPSWGGNPFHWNSSQFIDLLFLGKIDYHLYFIPLIFQFYLLYPVCIKFLKRWPAAFLTLSFLVQLLTFWYFQAFTLKPNLVSYSDQERYVLFTSWIWYFSLGMWLSTLLKKQIGRISSQAFWWGITTLSFFLMVLDSLLIVNRGLDVLDATSFTRYSVMLYASLAVYLSLKNQAKLETWPEKLKTILVWVGRQSFLIYLSHTLVLRVVFALTFKPVPVISLFWGSLVLIAGIIVSFRLQSKPKSG